MVKKYVVEVTNVETGQICYLRSLQECVNWGVPLFSEEKLCAFNFGVADCMAKALRELYPAVKVVAFNG